MASRLRRIDLGPFLEAGALLYDGPWLAERHAAVGRFIEEHPDDVHPITRSIIMGAGRFSCGRCVRRRVPPSRAGDRDRQHLA